MINILKAELSAYKENKSQETTLYYYQIEAVLEAYKYYDLNSLPTKELPIIVAPTGSGKSGIVTMLPYALGSRKVLILTPSSTISKQLADDFGFGVQTYNESFFAKAKIVSDPKNLESVLETGEVIKATKKIKANQMHWANLVIANAHKFTREGNRILMEIKGADGKILKLENPVSVFETFDTVIVDEAHHYPAKIWRLIIEEFKNKKIVFLTATPRKNPKKQEEGKKTYKIIHEIQKSEVEGKTIRKSDFFDDFKWTWSNDDELIQRMYAEIKGFLSQHNKLDNSIEHQAMVLVNRKAEARQYSEHLNKIEPQIATYCTSMESAKVKKDSQESKKESKKKKPIKDSSKINEKNFTNGKHQIMFVCGKLIEGYSNSKVSVCVILRNVRSTIMFTQFVGRCLRLNEKRKEDNIAKQTQEVTAQILSLKRHDQYRMWGWYTTGKFPRRPKKVKLPSSDELEKEISDEEETDDDENEEPDLESAGESETESYEETSEEEMDE
uniref:Helicase ATP-binding domain-containing protein n=1 Tax=Acrobeloides nanus TaxID=290746 RepID=A0A914CG84_9BILA